MRAQHPTAPNYFLALVALLSAPWALRTRAQETALAPVEAAPVIERVIRQGMTFVGTVRAPSVTEVSSAVDGRLARLLVEEGQRVERGELLAELETDLIEAQLAAATAELVLRQEELRELENGSRPEEIAEARAACEAARIVFRRRQTVYHRLQELFARGAVREDDLDEARAAYLEAKANLDRTEARLRLLEKGPRVEDIAQAKALVESQKHRVAELRIRLEKHKIRAPFTGYVTKKLSDVGAWLRQGDAVVQMVALDTVDAEVTVPEQYVARVRLGTEVTVRFAALPDRVFIGHVHRLIPQAIGTTRAFPLRLRLQNEIDEDGLPLIKEGFFLRANLPLGEPHQAVLVHKDALILRGQTASVAVTELRDSTERVGTVRLVPVVLGSPWREWIEVVGDLKAGELAIVRGNERLRPGQLVKVIRLHPVPEEPRQAQAPAQEGPGASE